MTGFTDWQDIGIFPLQDHEPGVAVPGRQQLVGGRIHKMRDPSASPDPEDSLLEYAIEDDKGTLGDVHPWAFWQTLDRHKRGMGSWSMAWSAMTTGGGTGGARGRYNFPVTPSKVHPINNDEFRFDARYKEREVNWPEGFQSMPQGALVFMMPGTDEAEQYDLMLSGDPRIFAPHVKGPAEAATLVVDLQPEAEPCMDGSTKPGIGGRHARITSMMRVVSMSTRRGLDRIKTQAGNMLAWNLGKSRIDKIGGYGVVWGELAATGGGTTSVGPVTPGSIAGRDDPEEGRTPREFGEWEAEIKERHGVAMMANIPASGPLCLGGAQDQHKIGTDRDGHPINSGHISTNGYFYQSDKRDGPLFFEEEFPEVSNFPLRSFCHIEFDKTLKHPWTNTTRNGKWRIWAEVPSYSPTTGEPQPPDPGTPDPPTGTPGAPTTPGGPGGGGRTPTTPRTPTTTPGGGYRDPGTPRGPVSGGHGGGNGGSGLFPDWLKVKDFLGRHSGVPWGGGPATRGESVGGYGGSEVGMHLVHYPNMSSFQAIAFRPQLWIDGAPSFEHHDRPGYELVAAEESVRPQTLSGRAWGAQTASGEWDYTERPHASRARGGIAAGGFCLTPPGFEMEDYFNIGIGADTDVWLPSSSPTWALAPGVVLGFGAPNISGGLNPPANLIYQDTADTTDGRLIHAGLNSSGSIVPIYYTEVTQSTGNASFKMACDLDLNGNSVVGGSTTDVSFTDADGNEHSIEVTAGIVTGWTVTPP